MPRSTWACAPARWRPALRSCLAVPLIEGESLVAVLALYRERPGSFSDDDLRLLELLAPRLASSLLEPADRRRGRSTMPARRAAIQPAPGVTHRDVRLTAARTATTQRIATTGGAAISSAADARALQRRERVGAVGGAERHRPWLQHAVHRDHRRAHRRDAAARRRLRHRWRRSRDDRADRADRPAADPLPLGSSPGPAVLRGVLPAWLGDSIYSPAWRRTIRGGWR